MRRTLSAFVVVASFVGGVSLAYAQLDDGIDGLGVYFDTSATEASIDGVVGDPEAIVDAYLILVNPSLEGQIDYWECGVVTDSEDFWGVWGEPTHGINILTNIPGSYFGFVVYVSEVEPFFAEPITILAQLHFGSGSPEYGAQIYLVDQGAGYSVVGSDLQMFNPSSGSWDLHVASINSTPPVATSRLTFGAIKSLFYN